MGLARNHGNDATDKLSADTLAHAYAVNKTNNLQFVIKFHYLLDIYRPYVEEEALAGLYQILSRLSDDFSTAGEQELQLQLMAECFRALRTACVQIRRNQTLIRYAKQCC